MEVNKLYPYPVLSVYTNDYKDCDFNVKIDVEKDGYDIKFKFNAELKSESILSCIKEGKAEYVYRIECPQTSFRKVVRTKDRNEILTVKGNELRGKCQLYPFVIATEDLLAYESNEFHNDYKGMAFEIEQGCVMAVAEMWLITIEKEIDEFEKSSSIFSITTNSSKENPNQMLVDLAQRKIVIKLPEEYINNYKMISQSPIAESIINSMIAVPALVYVLEEIKSKSIQERNEYSDSLWYRVLNKVLLKQFNLEIESNEFDSKDLLVIAQKLLNNPQIDAFKVLTSNFCMMGDDE